MAGAGVAGAGVEGAGLASDRAGGGFFFLRLRATGDVRTIGSDGVIGFELGMEIINLAKDGSLVGDIHTYYTHTVPIWTV